MKVLILAGGYGTRLSEETGIRPKPLVEIGGYPILWHIMKSYSHFGFNEFVLLLGYKGYMIKEFFTQLYQRENDFTLDSSTGAIEFHSQKSEGWKITFLDTGLDTFTGGRIVRASKYIDDKPFMLTYGDGVSDVNIAELKSFHDSKNKLVTMTSIIPEGRFGRLEIQNDNLVSRFAEKPAEENWINGGFFVCQPEMLRFLDDGDGTVLEKKPLEELARNNELVAYKHAGFWKCMDSMSDKKRLEELWRDSAPWKVW